MSEPRISSAERCRRALASAGYTRRQVTVRDSGNYMYSSLHVTIRDASVRISAVKEIADRHERIDRDSMTGEILSGGNTFVHVAYADSVIDPFVDIIAAGIETAPEAVTVEVAPGVWIARHDHNGDIQVWRGCRMWCCGARHAAQQIAEECLDAGVTLSMLVSPTANDWIARLAIDDAPAVDAGPNVN